MLSFEHKRILVKWVCFGCFSTLPTPTPPSCYFVTGTAGHSCGWWGEGGLYFNHNSAVMFGCLSVLLSFHPSFLVSGLCPENIGWVYIRIGAEMFGYKTHRGVSSSFFLFVFPSSAYLTRNPSFNKLQPVPNGELLLFERAASVELLYWPLVFRM